MVPGKDKLFVAGRQKRGEGMCNMWREGSGGSIALCFGLWGVGGGEKRGIVAAKTTSGTEAEAECGGRIPVRRGRNLEEEEGTKY